MSTATVEIIDPTGNEPRSARSIDVAVRVDHVGRASVELCTDDLGIVPRTKGAPTWHSLAFVMSHPDVRAVTFRGPWGDDYAAPSITAPSRDDDEPPGYSAGLYELGYEGDG